ncbi:hypothetical protein M2159_004002 [Streptomyces sp. SAI-090]|nr:hypothetical protein [Streptomyces sp. SAI-090]MDH6549932.1 hypothetical protein [Streptomyces sp. SAI-041]
MVIEGGRPCRGGGWECHGYDLLLGEPEPATCGSARRTRTVRAAPTRRTRTTTCGSCSAASHRVRAAPARRPHTGRVRLRSAASHRPREASDRRTRVGPHAAPGRRAGADRVRPCSAGGRRPRAALLGGREAAACRSCSGARGGSDAGRRLVGGLAPTSRCRQPTDEQGPDQPPAPPDRRAPPHQSGAVARSRGQPDRPRAAGRPMDTARTRPAPSLAGGGASTNSPLTPGRRARPDQPPAHYWPTAAARAIAGRHPGDGYSPHQTCADTWPTGPTPSTASRQPGDSHGPGQT